MSTAKRVSVALDLGAVLESYRSDAVVLKRAGHETEAGLIERFASDVERTAAPWINFIAESKAMLRSGRSRGWLRARFADWERDGNARRNGAERLYREAIIPMRHTVEDAHAAGIAAAQRMKRAS